MRHPLEEGIQDIHPMEVDKQTLLEVDILVQTQVVDRHYQGVVGRLHPWVVGLEAVDMFHPWVVGSDCSH